jgi:hypothetical protein
MERIKQELGRSNPVVPEGKLQVGQNNVIRGWPDAMGIRINS